MRTLLFSLFTLFLFSIYSQSKIAIIGGGMAGISSAYYIHQFDKKAQITIFEKEAQLGGNAQTIEVVNSKKEKIKLDIGPQYFTDGAWDDYLCLIDETIGLKNIQTEKFNASFVIQSTNSKKPIFITPSKGSLHKEKISQLLKIKKFNSLAYKVVQNPNEWRNKSTQQWISTLPFDEEFKTEIITPFLSATLGLNSNEINQISVVELLELFAFRKPSILNPFEIMTEGMGSHIIKIGDFLKKEGIVIKTSSPIKSIEKIDTKFEVHLESNESIANDDLQFDFIIIATHANTTNQLLSVDEDFSNLTNILKNLNYFKANIIVHNDSSFIQNEYPSFLNIFTNSKNEVASSTMNLSMISERLSGIYKSWLNEEDIEKIKSSGHFLAQSTFYHPMIDLQFIQGINELKRISESTNNLVIIGGWSEGLETQNSAVISGKRALKKYQIFKN